MTDLLSEQKLEVLETILHYSEMEEQKIISFEECIEACSNISLIKVSIDKNVASHKLIKETINSYPIYSSLRRGNFIYY